MKYAWKDAAGTTVNPLPTGAAIPGRILTTEIRYPTVRGSAGSETPGARAATGGPFPVIVFAHGFDVSPSYYTPLLDAWVRAGFVVVSPIFPDASTEIIASIGGPESTEGIHAEDDETYEPGDIPFVLKQLASVAAVGSGSVLSGVVNLSEIGMAGQSDGANVVAALSYGSYYSADLAAMPARPKAVEILSGQALTPYTGGTNSYSATASSPALLQVQSNADACNTPQLATDLFAQLSGAPVHLFETLVGAPHLDPYVGTGRWASVVEKVTTEFFEVELGWHDKGLTLAKVQASATVPNVSSIASSNVSVPLARGATNCASQLPTTTTTASNATG